MEKKNAAAVNTADKNAARLEKMRANLAALEVRAAAILKKCTVPGAGLTAADRAELLTLVNVAYHSSGKIETISSLDSTAGCEFCAAMRKAAENDPRIICGMCYAAADSWKEAAWRRHQLNAKILSSVLFTVDELRLGLSINTFRCRINEDGDVVNVIHGQNILRLFAAFPHVEFGFWYKNVAAVSGALAAEGITCRADRPKNARFVQSSVIIGQPGAARWFSDVVFTVYPDAAQTVAAIQAGAFECNGRKCKECGYNCYNCAKNGADSVQHVAEVLRCSAGKRSEILTACAARV